MLAADLGEAPGPVAADDRPTLTQLRMGLKLESVVYLKEDEVDSLVSEIRDPVAKFREQ